MTTLAPISRSAACNATVDQCDVGGQGKLKLRVGVTLAATIVLNATAFGDAVDGVATANGFPKTAPGVFAGNLTNFDITRADDTLLWSGTIGAPGSGADLILDNVNVAVDQNVTINSFTHTQPA